MKIGMLVIATNKYTRFIKPLIESARRYFLSGHDVQFFVFTDGHRLPDAVVRIEQEHRPFPYPTLKRYEFFWKHRELLATMDYLFYSDVDMLFVAPVGDDILGARVAVLHPGFYSKPRSAYAYETRPSSRACVGPDEGQHY